MTDEEIFKYLRITNPEYNEDGFLIKTGPNSSGTRFSSVSGDINSVIRFAASNFIAEIPSIEDAKCLKSAIKLFSQSFSSLIVGYEGDSCESNTNYLHPQEFYGKSPLALDTNEIATLNHIYEKVVDLKNDSKFLLALEKYQFAISSLALTDNNRFLELTIALEILLLPKMETELSYRFGLRMARLFRKHYNEDIEQMFEFAKTLYTIRSKLVHQGEHKKTSEILPEAIERTRQLLLLYSEKPSIFTSSSLDELCLE